MCACCVCVTVAVHASVHTHVLAARPKRAPALHPSVLTPLAPQRGRDGVELPELLGGITNYKRTFSGKPETTLFHSFIYLLSDSIMGSQRETHPSLRELLVSVLRQKRGRFSPRVLGRPGAEGTELRGWVQGKDSVGRQYGPILEGWTEPASAWATRTSLRCSAGPGVVYRASTCQGQLAGLWPEPGQEAGRGRPHRDMLRWEAAAQGQGWACRGLGGVMCSLPASAKARLESQMAVPPAAPWTALAHRRQGNVS